MFLFALVLVPLMAVASTMQQSSHRDLLALKTAQKNTPKEGQTIKCDASKPDIFRFTGGIRRRYPTTDIAASWDKNWSKASVVDCSKIPLGPDMLLHPSVLKEGQSITCDSSKTELFRYAGGKRRLYPTTTVAASWDKNWSKPTVVNCTTILVGEDMSLHPSALKEGQSIKCGVNKTEVFRYTGGKRRLYPTTTVAKSWDKNWSKASLVDCSKIPPGSDMLLHPSALTEGQSIKCDAKKNEVFRYTDGKRRLYPTTAIAASWDKNWQKAAVVDCTTISTGPNMPLNPALNLKEGQSLKCDKKKADVYRFTQGKRRLYPSSQVAASWDKNWQKAGVIDCTELPSGSNMLLHPSALKEGATITCDAIKTQVYRFTGGKRRLYPTTAIALSWDKNWFKPTLVECTLVPLGPDMLLHLSALKEGQSLKCGANATQLYRFMERKRRLYPTEEIAASWDPQWATSSIEVECSVLPQGNDMLINPTALADGVAIQCDTNLVDVYRYVNGQSRLYPNQEILTSWDPNWSTSIVVNCTSLIAGPDMLLNAAILPEGSTVNCGSTINEVYRLVGGQLRWYQTPELADSWDPNWRDVTVMDCTTLSVGPAIWWNPASLSDGSPIKCDPTQEEVYRLIAGHYHQYENPIAADSWDPNWRNFKVVDCTNLTRGITLGYYQENKLNPNDI